MKLQQLRFKRTSLGLENRGRWLSRQDRAKFERTSGRNEWRRQNGADECWSWARTQRWTQRAHRRLSSIA